MKYLDGHLLVAAPNLPDENFFRTVVLMVQHNDQGAFGLVLNHPLDVSIREIWQEIADEECECDSLLHLGGPVEGPLMALHTEPELSEIEVIPGVHVASEKDRLNQLVRSNASPLILFSGYSGWGADQLESEIAVGGWLTTPARYEHVFEQSDEMWKAVADEIGRQILFPGQNPGHGDPGLN